MQCYRYIKYYFINIYPYLIGVLEKEDKNFSTIISQLEDFYPDYQDQLYKTFLIFYLKVIKFKLIKQFQVIGFDNFESKINSESIQDVPSLIDEIQKLHFKKPEQHFNSERIKLLIDNKVQSEYKDRITSFFYDLYSAKTDILEKDIRFNQILIKQFSSLFQIKLRQSRTAAVYLVCLIASALIKHIQESQKKEYINLIQEIWTQIMREGIYDIDSAIKQQTMKFLINCFTQLPQIFNQPQYFDVIIQTFQQQHYEMREISLDNLNQFLQKQDDQLEEITLNLFTHIQTHLIQLINFEKNESIILKGFQVLEQAVKKLGGNFLTQATINSLKNFMFWQNYTIRYESGKILNVLSPIKSLTHLVEFVLEQWNQNLKLKDISELVVIPFLTFCNELMDPQAYISLILSKNDKLLTSEEKKFEVLLYIFAGVIKFTVEYKFKPLNFINLSLENEKIEDITNFQERSSEFILDNLNAIQYKFFGHENCFKAYLYLLMNFKFDLVVSKFELKQNLIKVLCQTLIKSKDSDEIAYCARLIQILTQQENMNQSFNKEQSQINELIEYLQQEIKKNFDDKILIKKATSVLLANLCSYTNLVERDWYVETPTELIIELLGAAVKNSFRNYILNTSNKNFEEYLEMRKLYYQKAFQKLNHIEVMNNLFYILSITNNEKSTLNRLHEELNQEQYQYLWDSIDKFILKNVEHQDDFKFSLISRLDKEQIELLKNIFDLLKCSNQMLFKIGLKIMKIFLELSLKHNDIAFQNRIMEIFQILVNKSMDDRNRQIFWRSVMEIVEMSKEQEEFQQKFSTMILDLYLNSNQQLEILKENFFQFFVDLIQQSHKNDQIRCVLQFLNNILIKKLFNKLQIENQVAKKMCIYYEQYRNKNVSSDYQKVESQIKNKLRAASNLRESEIKKYIKGDEENEIQVESEQVVEEKKMRKSRRKDSDEYVVDKKRRQ